MAPVRRPRRPPTRHRQVTASGPGPWPAPSTPSVPGPVPLHPADDRSDPTTLRHLVLGATVCGVVAGLLLFATSRRADGGVVLDVTDAVSETVPSTVAPLVTSPPPPVTVPQAKDDLPGDDRAGDDDSPAPGRNPIETQNGSSRSPLADLLGDSYSAVPAEVAPRPVPVGVETTTVDLARYPIRPVGLTDDEQLEIPDETEIGWYRYGATAGRPGATVLAAHVSWNGTTGPFFELGSMEPGAEIAVSLDDGTVRHYVVTERTMFDKTELPRDRIWRNTGDEQLVMITCGGDFNPDVRRYRQNIVVFASPIG